ncbi:RlmE family RNA methyltransferase [Methanothermobacter tenebrarum]|uniref:Ribosomal RNA large subunit methyltransferase E n=1 Tax=Methanothermobacter tenebrarum TaxID=680118 RepID=A0A328PJ79_9EURY|nr:RlmE family RNA methyltransferase [Methanothermobacter tenebrarum]MBC7118013.1 RlmE family RNA methyltransferase [Methanobacteriaceae archaeon]NPV64157.1 RlmE family RNA methyltransferase [Methanobacteriaceae archaeon]RAO79776.1 23S rRNA (uridine(2552)-2'-O)-methyltransferase [Methanothermobacter tenebrarum]
MGRRWYLERKRDYYYKSAKKQKYRSRASYKLLQLDNRFKLIRKGDKVVDLGAAPGGWSQVALEKVGDDGLVIAVDIKPIKPFPVDNFHAIKGDFTDEKVQEKIGELLGGKADVIISDASPSLSGIKNIDQLRSLELVENVIKVADRFLKKGGNLLVKVFQGPGFNELLKKLRSSFMRVKSTKPASSRKGSPEMYIVCKGFKGVK